MKKIKLENTTFEFFQGEEIYAIHPSFKRVEEYFSAKTQKKRLANRKDFSPLDFRDLLPLIMIFDVQQDESDTHPIFKFRIIGTDLTPFLGDQTGKDIRCIKSQQILDRLTYMLNKSVKLKKPLGLVAREVSFEKKYLQSSGIYYPMSSDGETIDKVMVLVHLTYENE